MQPHKIMVPIPSSALIIVREGSKGELRYLLLKRNSNLSYGSSYSFPGGRIEQEDISNPPLEFQDYHYNKDYCPLFPAALSAAIRELKEETGLDVSRQTKEIVPVTRIVTPSWFGIKRHDCQYFLLQVKESPELDNLELQLSENECYRWDTPKNFIEDTLARKILISPPILYQFFMFLELDSKSKLFAFLNRVERYMATFPLIFQYQQLDDHSSIIIFHADKNYSLERCLDEERESALSNELQSRLQGVTTKNSLDYRFLEVVNGHSQSLFSLISQEFRHHPIGMLGKRTLYRNNKLVFKYELPKL